MCLAIAYPLLVHLAVVTASAPLTALAIGCLATLVLGRALLRGSLGAWLLAAALMVMLARAAVGGWLWLPIYVPSIAADAFVCFLFARTLAPGQVPLIEQLVRLMHAREERLEASIVSYARVLTGVWALLFAALALVSLALALIARPNGILPLLGITPAVSVRQSTWSLFANFLEYAIVALFFLLEYAYRRRRFPQQPYTGMLDFLRRLSAVAPRVLVRREFRDGLGRRA